MNRISNELIKISKQIDQVINEEQAKKFKLSDDYYKMVNKQCSQQQQQEIIKEILTEGDYELISDFSNDLRYQNYFNISPSFRIQFLKLLKLAQDKTGEQLLMSANDKFDFSKEELKKAGIGRKYQVYDWAY